MLLDCITVFIMQFVRSIMRRSGIVDTEDTSSTLSLANDSVLLTFLYAEHVLNCNSYYTVMVLCANGSKMVKLKR